ncbi:MAG: hypothetical protein U1D35_14015, partial [Paracoccaceae bacterium]|nr:hypothetical protein [Paracoccaceae bacterium]
VHKYYGDYHALRPFDPRPINADFSERFLDRLRGQFVAANLSKFPQADRGSVPLIQGCLAVFAQDFKPPRHHRHYMTVPAMIDAAIAARGGRPLYIKPHPNNSPEELIQLRKYHDPSGGVYLTGASIHDLLAVADCAITLTSAVGFEGFLHKTPLVLGGQTDFHHNAITLTDPARMHDAITAALMRDWPHAKYLSWFLRQNYLADHPNSLPDLLDRVHRKGFAFADAAGRGFY